MSKFRLFIALLLTAVAVGAGIFSFRAARTEPEAPQPLWTKSAPPWTKTDYDAQVRAGDGHYDRGEHEQAIAAYRRALTVRDSAYVRTNVAVSLHALRRTDEALQELERALQLDPSYWKATFNELVIYANRQDYPRALARIERLRALQKTNAEIPPLDELEAHLRSRAARGG
jgi:tetratricopeptide (TPR) repeat protein